MTTKPQSLTGTPKEEEKAPFLSSPQAVAFGIVLLLVVLLGIGISQVSKPQTPTTTTTAATTT